MRKFTVLSVRQYLIALSKELGVDITAKRRFRRITEARKVACYCLHARGVRTETMGIAIGYDRTNMNYYINDVKDKLHVKDSVIYPLWRRIELFTSAHFYDLGMEELTDYEKHEYIKVMLDDFTNEYLYSMPILLGTRTRKELFVDLLRNKAEEICQMRDV
jgi:hypothetical protein